MKRRSTNQDDCKHRVAFVGTGYIADYHARALRRVSQARLAAVCDLSRARAATFASRYHVPEAFDDVERMLADVRPDVVHVLTPPDQHFTVGQLALDAGAQLLIEKPMCADPAGCEALLAKAERRNLRVGINHNFLFHPAYEQLRDVVRRGTLGPLDHIIIEWALELPQVKSGPFDTWALRQPGNILLEVGSHSFAYVLDLLPSPDDCSVRAADPIVLPTGGTFYRRWHVTAACGEVPVHLHLSFGAGYPQRSVMVRGDFGSATADLERNVCTVQRAGRRAQDFGKYDSLLSEASSLRQQARRNLGDYVLSKITGAKAASPFAASVERSLSAFYAGLTGTLDPRCSGQLGRQVVEHCFRLAGMVPTTQAPVARVLKYSPGPPPHADALVLGGTGFIGRELVRQLLKAGRTVRVMTRSRGNAPFAADPNLQVVTGDIRNPSDLTEALADVDTVFHLARAPGGTWNDYYTQDVLGTRKLAEACLSVGVTRLVYASSIVIYSLASRRPITEDTPADRRILRQNKYARAKAEAERMLMQMHSKQALPVVIVRPGMVVGRSGELCHAGVGEWNGPGSCVFWGSGRHELPLVLVEDVARGFIAAMDTPGIDGESFNLIDDPCLSSRGYVEEIERFSGLKINTFCRPLWHAFTADAIKCAAKFMLRAPERHLPSYRVWQSRAGGAVFNCAKARRLLGWQPVADRNALISRGLHVHLVEHADSAQIGAGGGSQTALASGQSES